MLKTIDHYDTVQYHSGINMPKVSKLTVDKHRLNKFSNDFWETVTLLKNKEEVKKFLFDILTHTERIMIAKRLQIAKMLLYGFDYQTIRSYLKVTDQTVARINNRINTGGEGLKIGVKRLNKIEQERQQKLESLSPFSAERIKKKYPAYYLPEKILETLIKELQKRKRKSSVKKLV